MTEFFVPKGWTRGQPLRAMGQKNGGGRYALFQHFDPENDFPDGIPEGDDIAAIEFDTREDAEAFLGWWHAKDSGTPSS